MVIPTIVQGSKGAAEVIGLTLEERCKAARRVLGIKRGDGVDGRDREGTMRRHLLVWIARADGSATVQRVAEATGLTHGAIVKILQTLRPFPGVPTVTLGGDGDGKVLDSSTEMLLRWVGGTAAKRLVVGNLAARWEEPARGGTMVVHPSHLDRVYAELRTDGWPWRRSGKLGNRGNRSVRS